MPTWTGGKTLGCVGCSCQCTAHESIDIGMDTRTAVDDSYRLPFRFTGTINKLTYKIGNEQLAADDRKVMQKALAGAHD
jgi:hypothetical protein